MMRKEGTRMVVDVLKEYWTQTYNKISYFIYDNSCHLHSTFKIKNNIKELNNLKFYIDRLHLKNHKCEECQTKYNIKTCKDLDSINSEVCEQNFFTLNNFKHITKHMDFFHYNFFYLAIFDDLNQKKITLIKKKK